MAGKEQEQQEQETMKHDDYIMKGRGRRGMEMSNKRMSKRGVKGGSF